MTTLPIAVFQDYVQFNSGKPESLEVYKKGEKFQLLVRDGDTKEVIKTIEQDSNGNFNFTANLMVRNATTNKLEADDFKEDFVIHSAEQRRLKNIMWFMQTQVNRQTPTGRDIYARTNPNSTQIQGFDITSDKQNEGIALSPIDNTKIQLVCSMNVK